MLRRRIAVAAIATALMSVILFLIDFSSSFIVRCLASDNNNQNYYPCAADYEKFIHNGLIVAGIDLLVRIPAELLTAFATCAIAAFTYTLWRATTEHSRITDQVLSLTRDEFIATHRPRMRVYAFEVTDRNIDGGKSISVLFQAQNIGESKAHITKLEGCIYIGRSDRSPESGIPFRYSEEYSVSLSGGERDQFGINGTAPSDVEAMEIYAGDTAIYCIGRLVYKDDIGIEREIGFCREFRFRPYRSRAVTDSEYEYTY
jgi:hypothetical protein